MSCGPGKLGDWMVPDSPLGVLLGSCCTEHDLAYASPGKRTRRSIDRAFYVCCRDQVRAHAPRWRLTMRAIALVYWLAVRVFGGMAWRRCRARDGGQR